MILKLYFTSLFILYLSSINLALAAGFENRTVTISSNERFDLVKANSVSFKFKPLSDEARKLEITQSASALGVAYLGQVKLKENITTLAALRSIADQIGESLKVNFGVVADSNTSEALKANELLLLYHPFATITLALARPDSDSNYEIICTYALKNHTDEQKNDSVEADAQTEQTQSTTD